MTSCISRSTCISSSRSSSRSSSSSSSSSKSSSSYSRSSNSSNSQMVQIHVYILLDRDQHFNFVKRTFCQSNFLISAVQTFDLLFALTARASHRL